MKSWDEYSHFAETEAQRDGDLPAPKAPDLFSAAPPLSLPAVPLEGLVRPGSAQIHRPGALEPGRTYRNEHSGKRAQPTQKYLEVGPFRKRTRSATCELGLDSVKDERGEWREAGRLVKKDGVRKPGEKHWGTMGGF